MASESKITPQKNRKKEKKRTTISSSFQIYTDSNGKKKCESEHKSSNRKQFCTPSIVLVPHTHKMQSSIIVAKRPYIIL